MSLIPTTLHIALDDTLGAAFIGHFVSTLLYGITSLQAYVYYRDNHNDSKSLKLSVAGLWILDTVHVALITGAMYWYCITNFTNLQAIQKPIWPFTTMIIVSNISNSIVRGCFGVRLYRLSHGNWWLPAIISAFSLFILFDAAYFAAKLWNAHSYAHIQDFSVRPHPSLSPRPSSGPPMIAFVLTHARCMRMQMQWALYTGLAAE
ncbi:hypothetical protein BD311DRAFT_698129, partial [Dichomitus squalens]